MIDTSQITRFEVIDLELGRVLVVGPGYCSLTLSVQDGGRTLKVFLKRCSCPLCEGRMVHIDGCPEGRKS